VEEVAENFDMLPRSEANGLPKNERVTTAPVLSSAGHADLVAAQSAPPPARDFARREEASSNNKEEESKLAYLRPNSYGR
jgi:hypothetical protein